MLQTKLAQTVWRYGKTLSSHGKRKKNWVTNSLAVSSLIYVGWINCLPEKDLITKIKSIFNFT